MRLIPWTHHHGSEQLYSYSAVHEHSTTCAAGWEALLNKKNRPLNWTQYQKRDCGILYMQTEVELAGPDLPMKSWSFSSMMSTWRSVFTILGNSVLDPHPFYADPDPDPTWKLNADPDPDSEPDPDPVSGSGFMPWQNRIGKGKGTCIKT